MRSDYLLHIEGPGNILHAENSGLSLARTPSLCPRISLNCLWPFLFPTGDQTKHANPLSKVKEGKELQFINDFGTPRTFISLSHFLMVNESMNSSSTDVLKAYFVPGSVVLGCSSGWSQPHSHRGSLLARQTTATKRKTNKQKWS